MFADHTNKNINVNEWFMANKLSLNSGKTKYIFFHKQGARDSIPLRLPTITFNSIEIKRESFIIIDENITWNKYIELVENKISKNIGIILYRSSHYLDKKVYKTYISPLFITMETLAI